MPLRCTLYFRKNHRTGGKTLKIISPSVQSLSPSKLTYLIHVTLLCRSCVSQVSVCRENNSGWLKAEGQITYHLHLSSGTMWLQRHKGGFNLFLWRGSPHTLRNSHIHISTVTVFIENSLMLDLYDIIAFNSKLSEKHRLIVSPCSLLP